MSTYRNTVQNQDPGIIITSKEQILSKYPNVFKGISKFPGSAISHTS